MARRRHWLAPVAAAVVIVAGASVAHVEVGAGPVQPSVKPPPARVLHVEPGQGTCDGALTLVEGETTGAAGTRVATIDVMNQSGETCSLDGVPTVVPSGTSGPAVEVIAGGGQGTSAAAANVVVPANGTAQFPIGWSDAAGPACSVVPRIIVTLPGQQRSFTLRLSTPAAPCGPRGARPVLRAGAVEAYGIQ